MLFLDYKQVEYCKLQSNDKTVSGIIYNGTIFTCSKSFPKEELEVAIKECREEYLDHEQRSQIPTLLIKGKNNVGIWMETQKYKKENIINVSRESSSSLEDNSKLSSDTSRLSIRKIASIMHSNKGVEIKTRRHKLKLYKRCFLGNEAVDWIVQYVKVSRKDAIKIGQKMLEKGIINHVTNDHKFRDKDLFYRFNEDKGKSIWNSEI